MGVIYYGIHSKFIRHENRMCKSYNNPSNIGCGGRFGYWNFVGRNNLATGTPQPFH
jgi:hypothetical protein